MSKPVITFCEKPRGYTVNGTPVPSVTQVLGILDKPALVGWTAKITAEGAWKLARRKGYKMPDEPWQFIRDLKGMGYDHRSYSKDAAARGTIVHTCLEEWIKEGKIPVAGKVPKPAQGYVRGLAKFLIERQPEFLESETVVGSAVHGFAGTRDTVCILKDKQHGRTLIDLKTSKRVYPTSHFPQLRAYEIAGVECGEEPTDKQGILRVGADGTYEIVWSCATDEDFLAVLRCYKAQQALTARAKECES